MKRKAPIRDLRRHAREHYFRFKVDKAAGKGSHYRVRMGNEVTKIQSGELSPFHVKRIREQLKVNPA